ncbi:hypothetical protein ALO78_200441 [Pseudomonas amygdali pv. ciccaronei]|nr:hypothetical protein ALO78_200441 [Pseudomonas amygdali pv. ciccaronei]
MEHQHNPAAERISAIRSATLWIDWVDYRTSSSSTSNTSTLCGAMLPTP